MIKKLILLLCFLPFVATAQNPMELVVPFAVGGPADKLARAVQKTLSQELDRPVVITYKIGGGGEVANSYVAGKNKNETVLLIQSSALASNAALTDFQPNQFGLVPLVHLGTMPILLAVPQKSKLHTFKSWQALDDQAPINIGSGEFGTSSYFHSAIFQHHLQKNLVAVPYRGQGQLLPDLIAGHVDAAFIFAGQALPLIENNQIRPVAVASHKRLSDLPTVPTFDELGIKNLDYYTWFILLSNQHTSTEEKEKIQRAMMKILSNKSDLVLYSQTGLQVDAQSINKTFVIKEVNRYQEIIKRLNLKPN